MNEATMQTLFGHWLKANWGSAAAFELKIVKRDRFYFRQIEDHQLYNLKQVKHGLFYHKIPDLGNQCPFDCYTLWKVPSYIVVLFYKPRQPKQFYMLDIDTVQGLIDDGKKSITEEEAKRYADLTGTLK